VKPGIEILERDRPASSGPPTDTGAWFVTGLAEKGPTAPQLVRSLAEFERLYGSRVAYSLLFDSLDAYFREGGTKAYVSRVLGPDALAASVTLDDAAAADTLKVTANSAGAWGNGASGGLAVEVEAGGAGAFVLVITLDGDEVERSPELATKADALEWAASSDYVVLTDLASVNDPAVVAATPLAGGTDDRASATDAHWKIALDRFETILGPGQVSAPGRTTAQSQSDLLAHAAERNRIALLDTVDSGTAATLRAAALALRTNADADHGALFAPWAVIPGLTRGSTRTVPYSAIEAGLMARSDAVQSPNIPAAGENGQARYAFDLSQAAWDDATRESLNDGGVNVARVLFGGVRTYGYRTLVDPDTDPNHVMLNNARLFMAIRARAAAILERYVFAQIDGGRKKLGQLAGELAALLNEYYEAGSLYGSTPQEAFLVDVGDSVNTPSSIAAGELHASLAVRPSPEAELVVLEIVRVGIQESL
jgi:hypothetical protein